MAFEFRLGIRIRAPREKVFEHILTPHHLARWWCSFAQVQPKPGGAFNFGGDYSIVPPEEHAHKCVFTAGEVRRSVTFTWPLFGAETVSTWTVDADGDGSVFRVVHSGVPRAAGACGPLRDVYRICLGNLKAITEGRGDSLRPEYAPITTPEIRLPILIDLPPARVFLALVRGTDLREWASRGGDALVNPVVGGEFRWGAGPEGSILELEPDRRLALSWRLGGADTRASFTLEPKSSGTGLYLTHDGCGGDPTDRVALRSWWSGLLVDLKNFLEAGETGFQEPYEDEQCEV